MTEAEAQARYAVSKGKWEDAVTSICSAVTVIRSAALRIQHDHVRLLPPAERRSHLLNVVALNTSGWSGGLLNTANLIEAAQREAAMSLLRQPPHDVREGLV